MLWQDGKKTDSWKINSGTIQNKQSSQDTFQPSTPSPHPPPSASLSLDFLPFKRQTCQQQQFTHKATSTASQYLGEEGQRKWSVGWREGRRRRRGREEKGIHIPQLALKPKPICEGRGGGGSKQRKRQQRGRAGEGRINSQETEKFKPICKDECLRCKGPRQEIRNMLNKSELKIKLRGRKFIDQQSDVFHRTSLL